MCEQAQVLIYIQDHVVLTFVLNGERKMCDIQIQLGFIYGVSSENIILGLKIVFFILSYILYIQYFNLDKLIRWKHKVRKSCF